MDKRQGTIIFVSYLVLSQVVSQTDDTDTKRATALGTLLGRDYRVALVVDQLIKSTHSNITKMLEIVKGSELTDIDRRKDAKRNFSICIVDVGKRCGWEGNLLVQVGHARDVEAAVELQWSMFMM